MVRVLSHSDRNEAILLMPREDVDRWQTGLVLGERCVGQNVDVVLSAHLDRLSLDVKRMELKLIVLRFVVAVLH